MPTPPNLTEGTPPTAPRKSYRKLRPTPTIFAEAQQTLATTSQRRAASQTTTSTPDAPQRQQQPEQDEGPTPDSGGEGRGLVSRITSQAWQDKTLLYC
jgi:hypothetical protein